MKPRCRLILALGLLSTLASCASSPMERFALQRIPIQIQRDKPIEIHLRLTGENKVAVECSSGLWRALTNGNQAVAARLVSSNAKDTQIGGFFPAKDYFVWGIKSWHYLFYVAGAYHATATVQITFRNAPAGISRAEIVIAKTPSDFGL